MDCCSSPYSEYTNRHPIGGLNGSSQDGASPYYNYNSSTGSGMRYPMQSTIPPIYRSGLAMPPLSSPALPQPPSNGIDSPVYNEYPNNDRYNNYPNHAPPYNFGANLQNGSYYNNYTREHNSNYNYYHPYDGYNRYSYHHKDTYSSNYNTYSSPYYQRDHNHHHQPPPPSPTPPHHHNHHHHHYHNPYMYNPHHAPQTPTYLTDTDGNQTSSSSNSNTPGSLYSEYPQSPVTPYPPSAPNITPTNNGAPSNATGFPYTNKDGKIRKSTGRDKEKSKMGSRKTSNNNSIDSSGMVDTIDRSGTPFYGPSQPSTYSNDPYSNFPFGGIMNRMAQPNQNSYMATQPLPSNFLGNQGPWSTSGGTLNRNKKISFSNETVADDPMPPPPQSGSIARTATPSTGGKNETTHSVAASTEKSDNCKTQPTTQSTSVAPKTSRPAKRTRKKAKPNGNNGSGVKANTTSGNSKIEQTQKEQQILSEINKNITPLPGFQQAFGSTEIGRFSEVFFNLSESPIIDQLFVESEADTLSPQPWETGDSLEGPHFNLQIGAYYADNYYNNNNNINGNTHSGNTNNTNSSDLYSNTISNCINNNYNYYQYDSGGSSCSTNSNNYSLYNSNNSNSNFIGNNSNINNCYFREIRCSDY